MICPPIPHDEEQRLARLRALDLLDTGTEPLLDSFTALAAKLTGQPIALISLIDKDRQWFKSAVGLTAGGETSRDVSFCGHAIHGKDDVMVVGDARHDERFHDNPYVTGEPRIASYAGASITMPGGERIGTLCVAGPQPRTLSPTERTMLGELARTLVQVLLLRENERAVARQYAQRCKLLESIVEHLPQGLLVLDHDRRMVLGNTTMQRMMSVPVPLWNPGTSFDSLVLDSAHKGEYGSGDAHALASEVVKRALASEDPRDHVRPDGTVLSVRASHASDWHILTYADVTQQRKATKALRESEERLQAAMNAARQASVAKSKFIATMSHEVRTPLNGVIGFAQILECAPLPPREKEYVGLIHTCARNLLALVNDVLDLAKIEAGKATLKPVDTDIQLMLRELAAVYEASAQEKGLDFHLQVADDLPARVIVDPDRIRQVLLNLLSNAVKFTHEGAVSIQITALAHEDPPLLRFAVSDTGIGIAAHDQSRLFSPFYQVDGSERRKYRGTGLGLAIARELTELMNGSLSLASEPARGSIFTLDIPYAAASRGASAEGAPKPLVTSDRTTARVLLVEDDPINQLVARALLERLGLRDVELAENGEQALRSADGSDFDLVLMDCQMPIMDGWEATRRLRARGFNGPIVALTAGAGTEDRDTCLQCGMDDYLTKPVHLDELAVLLDHWLPSANRRGVRRQLPSGSSLSLVSTY